MKIKLMLIIFIISNTGIAQVPGYYFSKEFSKDISLYRAKAFVMQEVFGASTDIIQFEIDPLAASASGQVTSLYYRCDSKNNEGLILGFYGNYWNEAGVVYQGFHFKNLPRDKALELLDKISKTIENQKNYMLKDPDNNNVYFQYDDMLVLIYSSGETKIRLFWNNFDSEWESTAFKRTKKRFEKNLN